MNAYVQSLLGILLSAILTENFILVKFYGICPFMGVSKKIDTACFSSTGRIKFADFFFVPELGNIPEEKADFRCA